VLRNKKTLHNKQTDKNKQSPFLNVHLKNNKKLICRRCKTFAMMTAQHTATQFQKRGGSNILMNCQNAHTIIFIII